MKFATKPIDHYPLHLQYVATLPREIRSTNLLSQKVLLFKLHLNVPVVH